MRTFLLFLALILPWSLRAASAGDKIEVISGLTPDINWSTQPIKTWTLSGNSTPTQSNVPSSTTQRTSLEIKIVQPAAQSYTITTPSGWIWLTSDWSTLPSDTTNRVILEKIGSGVFATWVEAPGDIWENVAGVIQARSAQTAQVFYLLSTSPDDPSSVTLMTDTSVAWTAGNLAEFRNNGALGGSIAAVSGYTGGGTLYLSDDGTYKPATGGSNLWAYTLGLLYPSPAVDLVAIDSQLSDASTNVALLVTSVNTWTGGELIKAVNNSDTMFSVSGVSGYTGTGTLFLSDDGTYKSAGGGGDSIWTNILGVIQPIGTGLTNVFSFTSGLVDNATNIAHRVNTVSAWTGGHLAESNNSNTNVSAILAPRGTLTVGQGAETFFGSQLNDGPFITTFADIAADPGVGTSGFMHEAYDSGGVADNYIYGFVYPSTGAQFIVGAGTNIWTLDVDPGSPSANTQFSYDNSVRQLLLFKPDIASTGSAIAYKFDTSRVLTNGDKLVSIGNAGVEQMSLGFNSGLILGNNAQAFWGPPTASDGIIFIRDSALGDVSDIVSYFQSSATSIDYGLLNFQIATNVSFLHVLTFTNGVENSGGFFTSTTNAFLTINIAGAGALLIDPAASDGNPVFDLNSSQTHTFGNLLEIANNGTLKDAFRYDGALLLGTSTNILFSAGSALAYTNTAVNGTGGFYIGDGAGYTRLYMGASPGQAHWFASDGSGVVLANNIFGVEGGFTMDLGQSSSSNNNFRDAVVNRNLYVGLTGGSVVMNGSTNTVTISSGSGTPEGSVTRSPGALYLDMTNGEAYIKVTGTGNTGWKIITHAMLFFIALRIHRRH